MPPARKPSLRFGQKLRSDWSASAAIVECALLIRTASSGTSARPIKEKMDSDRAQAALATVCQYVNRECRDGVLVQLRKQRQAANQRALVARRKTEQLQLEIAFLRVLNRCLLYQIRQVSSRLDVAIHRLQGLAA